jgi:hypothetical protein
MNIIKKIAALLIFVSISATGTAQMNKSDMEVACSKITYKTHSHFNLVHNNNVDKMAMEEDFSLEFSDHVLIIHNGLNEIYVSYAAIKYISVGKPDKAHSEVKGQWYIMF